MICPYCNGDKWLRRTVPHPVKSGSSVTVTRICPFCQGKGTVQEVLAPSGKDRAANDHKGTEEKDLLFSS